MWRSWFCMLAVWWRPPRAVAPAGKGRLARPVPLQTTFPCGGVHRIRTFCSRPIPRWPCLIRSGRAVAAVAAAGAEVRVAALEGAVEVDPVVPVEGPEQAVKAAPAEAQGVEERVAPVVAAPAAAGSPTPTIPLSISHAQSCRPSRLQLRPTSRYWPRWRKEQAVSRFLIPTTCSRGSNASGASRARFTYLGKWHPIS